MQKGFLAKSVALSLAFAAPAYSQNPANSWIARGPGAKTCEYWTASFKSNGEAAAGLVNWLSGFLSGVNASRNFSGQNGKLSENKPIEHLLVSMDRYCRDNPKIPVSAAAQTLMYGLIREQLADTGIKNLAPAKP